MNFTRTLIAAALVTIGSAAFAQVTLNQSRAETGNVTPGDTAGFPITISQPGSYKLTSNLVVPDNAMGIEISSANVTLDLNGFSVIGPGTCSQVTTTRVVTCAFAGAQGYSGIGTGVGSVVKNGNVQGFSGYGVRAAAGGELLERLHLTQNNFSGLGQLVSSTTLGELRVIDSAFFLNRLDGANLSKAVVSGSRFSSNGDDGLQGTSGTLVQDSVSFYNFAYGLRSVSVKGTVSQQNGTNRIGVVVMGVSNNIDGLTTY